MSIQTTKKLRIGISFDHPDEYPEVAGPDDRFAEFEPESTIAAMEAAIRHIGARPVRVGGPRPLLRQKPDVDLIWNISEGYGSRNRESWVPLICKIYRIPCIGSEAFTLDLSLDKSATKRIAQSLGIPTSHWTIARFDARNPASGDEFDTRSILRELETNPSSRSVFPLFVKPRYEGTGKGITASSVVHHEQALGREIRRQFELYQQDLLVERFLEGAEFTLALSGTPLRCHPVLERGLDTRTKIGMHVMDAVRERETSHSDTENHQTGYILSHLLSPQLESKLQDWSLKLCHEMQILDFARLDFKMDADGNPFFLEVNTLPTFAADNTFAILAELDGKPYHEFLGEILRTAVRRIGFEV